MIEVWSNRQTQIAQLQSELDTLQQAATIMGDGETAPAKGRPKSKPKAKVTATPQPTPKAAQTPQPTGQGKRRQWTPAEKAAIGKRMKKYWAKRRKASAPADSPPKPAATQKRTSSPRQKAVARIWTSAIPGGWACPLPEPRMEIVSDAAVSLRPRTVNFGAGAS